MFHRKPAVNRQLDQAGSACGDEQVNAVGFALACVATAGESAWLGRQLGKTSDNSERRVTLGKTGKSGVCGNLVYKIMDNRGEYVFGS